MKLAIKLVVLAATLSLAACVQTGTKSLDTLSYSDIQKQLIRGKTTKAQVRQRFGEPRATSVVNGKESWIYNRAGINTLFGVVNKFVTLTISFRGNVVSDYQYNKSNTSTF